MPKCSLCGRALTKDETDEQYDTCGTCRSPAGKLQELWLAIQTGPQNGQDLISRCGPAATKLMAILEVWFGRIGDESLYDHFVRWLEGNRLVDSPEHARWMTIAKAVEIAADAAAGKTNRPPGSAVDGSKPGEASATRPEMLARGNEDSYRFECGAGIVQIFGFGECVLLEKTAGLERLIAILTRRRVSVRELAHIGSPPQDRGQNAVDLVADNLSERETINDDRFESGLGNDVHSAVRDVIGELIGQRDAALADADEQKAAKLTAQINATLQVAKSQKLKAAGIVRKSLDRTYDRLCNEDRGAKLASHFRQFVTRPRNEWDYVYSPDESHQKIDWMLK